MTMKNTSILTLTLALLLTASAQAAETKVEYFRCESDPAYKSREFKITLTLSAQASAATPTPALLADLHIVPPASVAAMLKAKGVAPETRVTGIRMAERVPGEPGETYGYTTKQIKPMTWDSFSFSTPFKKAADGTFSVDLIAQRHLTTRLTLLCSSTR